jgi:hypothetical protein
VGAFPFCPNDLFVGLHNANRQFITSIYQFGRYCLFIATHYTHFCPVINIPSTTNNASYATTIAFC